VLPSAYAAVFDEEATAERAAWDRLWLPVLRPAPERCWEAVVVVDYSTSMIFWRDVVAGFVASVERAGAFRNVARRTLVTSGARPGSPMLGSERGAAEADPAELDDPNGRRVVLVVTDGIARAWRTGAAEPLLRRWACRQPTAVLHLLPHQLWHHSGIPTERERLRTSTSCTPNKRLILDDTESGLPNKSGLPSSTPSEAGTSVPVPVLQLEPRSLGQWARLVGGSAAGWAELAVLRTSPHQINGEDAPVQLMDSTAYDRVAAFRASATPQALTLATHLAAAPLNVTMIRAIQYHLLPNYSPAHLSEILLAGLVRPVVGRRLVDREDAVTFDFDVGIREELLAHGRRADTVRVLQLVQQVLGTKVTAVRRSARALDHPDGTVDRVTPVSEPFLRAERAALNALSGRYLPRARRVGAALAAFSARTNAPVSGSRVVPPEVGPDALPKRKRRGRPATSPTPTTPNPTGGAEVPTTIVGRDTTSSPTRDAATVVGGLPPRNRHFTGRESMLVQLHDRLMGGPTAVLPEALHGKGGVGKSQLAAEYVYRHMADYDLIWWIPAERPAQIGSSLVELAQRLELNAGNEANTAVPALKAALAAGRPDRWLLVFDNADAPEDVQEYFPTGLHGPRTSAGRILVTSRNNAWGAHSTTLEVDVFERDESRSLLLRRAEGLAEVDAERLADTLGDLPLAVEQAANWIAVTGMPAAEYLDLLDRKRAELAAEFPELGYELPVAAAWRIALDRLETINRAALQLLNVCSFLAPDPISWDLFANVRARSIAPDLDSMLRDRTRLRRAIRLIDRFGLAKVDETRGTLQLHRLVQTVVASRLETDAQGKLRHGAHLVLASNDPNDWSSTKTWPTYADLYPHIIGSRAFDCDEAWVRQLVINEAKYLWKWGAHDSSRDLAGRTYEAWREKFGDEDVETTIEIARWLAWMNFVVGQFGESRDLNDRIYQVFRRLRGDDDEDTLVALGEVAGDLRVEGDFTGALDLAERVHRQLVEAFGEDDPTVLKAAHNVGVSLRLTGEYRQALDLDEATWRRKIRTFGAEDDSTLKTMISVNIDRWELGDYSGARRAQEEVVATYRRTIQDDSNPSVLFAIRMLAVATRKAGDHDTARVHSEDVSRQYTSRYGHDYPATMDAALNLSIDRRQTGDLNAAYELGTQTYRRYRHTLGENHPHTLSAAANLAVTLRLRGDVDDAYRLNRQALAGFEARLGATHPAALLCATNLASDAYARGEFDEAEERDREVLARSTERLGAGHPATLVCAANLALDLQKLGRTDDAERLHATTVASLTQCLGATHPATRQTAEWRRADCDIDPMPL
jgi:tetratricopeptide (TPR) repeat protein